MIGALLARAGQVMQNITTDNDNVSYNLVAIFAVGLVPFACGMTVYDVVFLNHAWNIKDFGQGMGLVLIAVASGFKLMQSRPGSTTSSLSVTETKEGK
jgi:hypothetical protein